MAGQCDVIDITPLLSRRAGGQSAGVRETGHTLSRVIVLPVPYHSTENDPHPPAAA